MANKSILSLVVILAASLVLAACGGSSTTTGAARGSSIGSPASTNRLPMGSVDVDAADCSGFRTHLDAFVPDMVSVAVDAAEKKHRFLAACFDGGPMRTLTWDQDVDFAERKPGIDEALMKKVNLARALGLRSKLLHMVETTPEHVKGSGQLELLELLSQTEGLGRAYVFTDGIINQIDGLNLTTASERDITRLVRRWVPRMGHGLRHVAVTFVGVGLGTHRTANIRKAKALFRGIVVDAGGTFTWAPHMPQLSA